jgi:hypothetical protein
VFVFHAWITVSLPTNESCIVSGLVSKGYDVSPAADTKQLLLTGTNTSYGVVACKIERELASVKDLYADLEGILSKNYIQYYSVTISEYSANCLWNAGNIASDKFVSLVDKKDTKKIVN